MKRSTTLRRHRPRILPQAQSDVEFVGEQVLRNLIDSTDAPPMQPPHGAIVVVDLSPADTVHLHRNSVAAIITDAGGRTSHTSIPGAGVRHPGGGGAGARHRCGGHRRSSDRRWHPRFGHSLSVARQGRQYRQIAHSQHRHIEELLRERDEPAEDPITSGCGCWPTSAAVR